MFIVAASNMVLSFRTDLIKKFQSEGYGVAVVAFDNDCQEQIEKLGVKFYCAFDNNFLSVTGIPCCTNNRKRQL